MPFRNYQIDPARLKTMRSAFQKVCDALLLKGEIDDPITDIIASKIVTLAKSGQHDAERLADLYSVIWWMTVKPPPNYDRLGYLGH